jgi:ubiquinone/menaquinone biosynthesis C-methylase UbiE
MDIKKVKQYFMESEEVFLWWDPENDIMSSIYQRILNLLVKQLGQFPNIISVLDAGCGKGRITQVLADLYNVTAVDISETMINYVKELDIPAVRVVKSDLASTPFLDNEFDAVVCLETLVHLPDIDKVFCEFYRIIKHNGILIIDFDNKYGFIRLIKDLFHFLFKIFDARYKAEREKREQIFRTLSRSEIIHALSRSGFRIIRIFYIGVIVPLVIKNTPIITSRVFKYVDWLNRFLEKMPIIKIFSTYIFVVCQK